MMMQRAMAMQQQQQQQQQLAGEDGDSAAAGHGHSHRGHAHQHGHGHDHDDDDDEDEIVVGPPATSTTSSSSSSSSSSSMMMAQSPPSSSSQPGVVHSHSAFASSVEADKLDHVASASSSRAHQAASSIPAALEAPEPIEPRTRSTPPLHRSRARSYVPLREPLASSDTVRPTRSTSIAIIIAAKEGDLERLRQLLSDAGSDAANLINTRDSQGNTPCM